MPSPRAQDLVFTLYGDYLLARERPVWTGALVTLLQQLGIAPATARMALSRMTRRGWLLASRQGTHSFYGLTRRGRNLLEEGRERIYHPPVARAWDGAWSVVTYTIPEDRRAARDALRLKLRWLGCGALASGVWLSPHDVADDVRRVAVALGLEQCVEVFRGAHQGFSATPQLVAACWDLAALNERYAAFIAHWRHHARVTSPAACFRSRFLLVHEYRAFPLDDPYLPAALLPAGWQGTAAARLFERHHATLRAGAVSYVAGICAEGDHAAAA